MPGTLLHSRDAEMKSLPLNVLSLAVKLIGCYLHILFLYLETYSPHPTHTAQFLHSLQPHSKYYFIRKSRPDPWFNLNQIFLLPHNLLPCTYHNFNLYIHLLFFFSVLSHTRLNTLKGKNLVCIIGHIPNSWPTVGV